MTDFNLEKRRYVLGGVAIAIITVYNTPLHLAAHER